MGRPKKIVTNNDELVKQVEAMAALLERAEAMIMSQPLPPHMIAIRAQWMVDYKQVVS